MTSTLAWMALIVAGLLEIVWAIATKYADGYSRPGWAVVSLLLLAGSVYLLGRALQALPVGIAYTVWTGIGAIGTVLMGTVLFGETLNPVRAGGIALVLAGVIALRLAPA